MDETTQRRSSRTGRFLTVVAVIFGIATMTYTYLLPKKITLPQHGISFQLPSPALISWTHGWANHNGVDDKEIAYLFTGDIDFPEGHITVSNARCVTEQTERCTHEEVFDYLLQDKLHRISQYGNPVFVYLVPIGNDDFMYSTAKGCTDPSCAYRWRSGDHLVYIRHAAHRLPIEHASCDVATQIVEVDDMDSHLPFRRTYASIRCDGAHVVMDISDAPEDEIEAIIASVSVLE